MILKSFQAQSQAHVGGVAIQEPVAEATRPLLVVEGKGADSDKTTSGGDTEILQIDKDQGKDVNNQVNLEEKTVELDQGQAGSNPGKIPESRPLLEQEFMEEDHAGPDPGVSRVAVAGPNPEPTHEEFMANLYLDVHGSLKLPVDEHVIIEEPLSSSGTLSSIKNLDDAYTFGDQFLNDKSTKYEPGKLNMDSKMVYMVTVPIHHASSSIPPLSTPIINLSPPKPVPATTHAPIFTVTTMTTTITLLLPPPPPQQSTSDSELAGFHLGVSRSPYKIDQTINTVVKAAVHIALQASLRDRFRELPEADMKEILHQRMLKSSSYKSLPKHVALYEALEVSMECANRDEFLAEKEKSRKRRRDDQDPRLPPSDLFQMEECHRMLTDQVDLVNPKGHRIVPDIRKPLPLEGDKGRRSTLSISKKKAAHYLDFRLEELVLSLYIQSEREYDISVVYEIVLRRSDYKEYKISEADFKILHPNDFEDLYLLLLQ
nr:hypothetical protein [Tanacetum cinerariifolium]